MSRIGEAFERCAIQGRGALVCYLTAGFPDVDSSLEYMLACERGGADVLEVGVPFSDPVADGKTIQRSSRKALECGITPGKVMDLVASLRSRSSIPIVLMGYYNPIFCMGDERFVRRAAHSGTDGLIVADMPCEESSDLRAICAGNGIDLIQLVGPTTDRTRMARIAGNSSGYLYLVSGLGTTGVRRELSHELPSLIRRAKSAAGALPVTVGFGISTADHVHQVISAGADGVIVGSALLDRIEGGMSPETMCEFVSELKASCSSVPQQHQLR